MTSESMFTSQVICERVLPITILKIRTTTCIWRINVCKWKAKATQNMKRETPWAMMIFRSTWMSSIRSIISALRMTSCPEWKILSSTHSFASSARWIRIIVTMYSNCLVSIFFWMRTLEFGSSSAITTHSWEHHANLCALLYLIW